MHKALGIISILITLWAMLPYIRGIQKGKIKPHVFSWIIWGSTTAVVGIAQFMDRGGAGSWPVIFSGVLTFYIAYLAFVNKSDNSITHSDKAFFAAAMSAIPIWIVTNDPLWAVLVLTIVDLLGYGPTFRKSYEDPYQESLPLFVIMTGRNLLAAVALEHYSLTTLTFPLATALANTLLIVMILIRRKVVNLST